MTTSILIYILAFVIIILLVWIITLESRLKKFFAGTQAADLEEVMTVIAKQMGELKKTQIEINGHLVNVDDRLNKSIRSIKIKRFNPFLDAGSNQSFAIALLNDEGNGLVMSSLYARDRMSIFAKPIILGKSEFELSDEEAEVLKEATK